MFEKKQNVFDDFFAAAEYLIANKYTTAERLAIRGRSNGGLLMGAAMTQRPDLFGAIWCGYPLLDMMRYQNFLVGRWWTTEYGSAENAQQFPYLLKYSPYQNVKPGTKYPASCLTARFRHACRSLACPQNDRADAGRNRKQPPDSPALRAQSRAQRGSVHHAARQRHRRRTRLPLE